MEATSVSIDRGMDTKDVVCVYMMEYHTAIKKSAMMPSAATRMDLETVIPSEVNQKEKGKYHMISLM